MQRELLAAIAATGKPIITVNMSGSCVSLSEFAKSSRAVIQMFYPGECGGTALADVLFGRQNPCGRLPVTFYKSTGDLPDIRDYSMKGRTYRFFTGEPEYPFGYGKSYTEFAYSDAAAERDGDAVVISANVTNTGRYPGRDGHAVLCPASVRKSGACGICQDRACAGRVPPGIRHCSGLRNRMVR